MKSWSKSALRDELLRILKDQLTVAERAHQGSVEAATHEEAKPEKDKDTRALEQSYLARGQAQRLVELRAALTLIQNFPTGKQPSDGCCGLGSLAAVEVDGRRQTYWIAPAAGGTLLADGAIQVVTPQSPLGRALVGCAVGDDCEVRMSGSLRELSIIELQ
jgi:transcription elongation GreA/GreB family factor